MPDEVTPGCYLHERPLKGWQLDRVDHVRHLGMPSLWRISLIRQRDGAPASYESPAGLNEAYRGALAAAVEIEKGDTI